MNKRTGTILQRVTGLLPERFPRRSQQNHAFIVENRSKEVVNPAAVKKMFEADFSKQNTEARGFSQEDRKFMKIVEAGITHCHDGHYEMPLTLKEQNLELPNNYELASRRLMQLKKRFLKDEHYQEDYVKFMKGYTELRKDTREGLPQ